MSFDSEAFLATVPHSSGVYRMFNSDNVIIYIGKAKDLRKRLGTVPELTGNIENGKIHGDIFRNRGAHSGV